MKRLFAVVVVVLVLLAAMLFWGSRKSPQEVAASERADDAVAVVQSPRTQTTSENAAHDPRRTVVATASASGLVDWPEAESIAADLKDPDRSVSEDIQIIHSVLGNYTRVFGELPPGGLNEEFVRALAGENPKRIRFLIPADASLNSNGELLDRWGTAYFFHKISSQVMDLRSAGPDRRMWTGDDVFDEGQPRPPM